VYHGRSGDAPAPKGAGSSPLSRRWIRGAVSAASLAAAAGLLAVLPTLLGVDWAAVGVVFGRMSGVTVAGLFGLWTLGLLAYAYVLTASLPGLTVSQALTLNAAGTGVSNLLPFGGAAGAGVTYAMARGWGHNNRAIFASILVSGVWNLMARFLLPAVGIVALLASGRLPDRRLSGAAVVALAVLVAVALVLGAVLRRESAATRLAALLDRTTVRVPRRLRAPFSRAGAAVLGLRQATADVVRRRWARLSTGMAAYLALQCLLMWGCLAATGTRVGAAETLAAFSLNRVLTTVVVTPSGTGISEAGTAVLLTEFGAPAAPVAAAVLLYSLFTFALEVPAGGVAWAVWAVMGRWRRPVDRGTARGNRAAAAAQAEENPTAVATRAGEKSTAEARDGGTSEAAADHESATVEARDGGTPEAAADHESATAKAREDRKPTRH
jgi:uncharacterized protein (TIRG00374 family)